MRIAWNGGRNGWASFIVGFGWMPGLDANASPRQRWAGVRAGNWSAHLYLGLWAVTLKGRAKRKAGLL